MPFNEDESLPGRSAENPELKTEYSSMRKELESLMSAPVKNFPRIDELIGRLELLQLAIKGEKGIKGNYPNE